MTTKTAEMTKIADGVRKEQLHKSGKIILSTKGTKIFREIAGIGDPKGWMAKSTNVRVFRGSTVVFKSIDCL